MMWGKRAQSRRQNPCICTEIQTSEADKKLQRKPPHVPQCTFLLLKQGGGTFGSRALPCLPRSRQQHRPAPFRRQRLQGVERMKLEPVPFRRCQPQQSQLATCLPLSPQTTSREKRIHFTLEETASLRRYIYIYI